MSHLLHSPKIPILMLEACDFLESDDLNKEDKNIFHLEVSMATAAINFLNVFFMLEERDIQK